MSCNNLMTKRSDAIWPISAGLTFLCCSLMIYYGFPHNSQVHFLPTRSESASVIQTAKLTNEDCKLICTTADCIEIGNMMISHMNINVNPCDNFYEFACGNFPEDLVSKSDFMHKQTELYLKEVIETSKETNSPGSAAEKLKILYDSCINWIPWNRTSIQPFVTFLNEIGIRNWPNLDSNFTFSNPTLPEVLGRLVTFEQDYFFRFSFDSDNENYTAKPGHLQNVSVSDNLGKMLYFFNKEYIENQDVLNDVLIHIGMNHEDINKLWQTVTDITSIFRELTENYDESSFKKGEHRIEYCNTDEVSNKSIICKVLHSAVHYGNISSAVNTEFLIIPLRDADYLDKVSSFLNSYDHRALAKYIALRVFINNIWDRNFLRMKFNDFIPSKYYEGWSICIGTLKELMMFPLLSLFTSEMFPPESTEEIDNMTKEVLQIINQFVRAQMSIPEDVKEKLTKQIGNEKNVIIDIIKLARNRSMINEMYKTFHPIKDNFLVNELYLRKEKFTWSHIYHSWGQEQIDFLKHNLYRISSNNGFYKKGVGIHLMFGSLIPPFYKYEYPKLFNIAQLGWLIPHEVGHSVYDGFMKNAEDDNQTRNFVQENMKCRANHYSQLEFKNWGQLIRMNETENEDFSDHLAVQVTEAMMDIVLRNKTDRMFALPSMDFSAYQLYYILYAQTKCEISDPDMDEVYLVRDSHSPYSLRIIGSLQNSKRFSQVFECPTTSFMNPQQKCPAFH